MGHDEQVQHGPEVDQHHQTAVRKSSGTLLIQGTVIDWFHTSVGVCRGCLLSPTLFKVFLESTMTDAPGEHHGTVSTGGRFITNFLYAYDIDWLEGEDQELTNLVNRIDKAAS